jgi:drug/metabolite transporter (DMT)-like permease
MTANLLALCAIALWASLAALGVALSHVPPFLLTGLSLLVGCLIALPLSRFDWRQWRVPASTLALGVYGLFGFHFLLFIALRHAPPVQANLVNYLWPLGIVVMAPLFLPGVSLTGRHVLAALMGFPVRHWRSWVGVERVPKRSGPGAMCRRPARPSSGPATR